MLCTGSCGEGRRGEGGGGYRSPDHGLPLGLVRQLAALHPVVYVTHPLGVVDVEEVVDDGHLRHRQPQGVHSLLPLVLELGLCHLQGGDGVVREVGEETSFVMALTRSRPHVHLLWGVKLLGGDSAQSGLSSHVAGWGGGYNSSPLNSS